MTDYTKPALPEPFWRATVHTDGLTAFWDRQSIPYLDTATSCDAVYTAEQTQAHADACVAAATKALLDTTALCDKHMPNGGKRGQCVICSGLKLADALSRISYLCGPPNEMLCGPYDLHQDEDKVVEQVIALRSKPAAWRYRYSPTSNWHLSSEPFIGTSLAAMGLPETFEQEPLYP